MAKLKSAAKKAPARRTPARGRARKAVPPPDNPLLRHEELSVDRSLEGEEPVESESLLAAMSAAAGRKPRRRARRAAASTVQKLSILRLRALVASRGLALDDETAPARLRARAFSGTAPAEVEMVAPVSGTSNWVQLGPTAIPKGQTYSAARVFVTGRVTAIVVDPTDPNIIYIGTAQGGVWKTTDGGLNWVARSDNEVSLAIGALAMDPSNHLVLYAGTGEGNFSGDSYYGNGVLKTTDGGVTWTTLAQSTFAGARFGRIAVTPGTPARLFAATNNGLYRSLDSGATWAKMTGSSLPVVNATDVCIDPSAPAVVYASFWGGGVYKSVNAGAAAPTWTKLAGGLPTSNFTRIALGLSTSSPQTIYALLSGPANANPALSYLVNAFLRSTDGGSTWTAVPLPGGNIGGQGFYNLGVTVDPTTPDIVFLSAVSVWKASRNSITGAWTITNVGGPIHPDNHAFAFQPGNHLIVYAGNDGGIYRSTDGGVTWSDTINEGPCITQFEFIDQHPTSDAVVFGGTQDNGTEQFRNSPVFNHADDGDGGSCLVDRVQSRNVISTYYFASPKRSTQGGKFGTWFDVSGGITGTPLFYPPLALDQTNPSNVALGTTLINLDAAQGVAGWPTKVMLPGLNTSVERVSAIHYVNSSLIYAGTTQGKVYRLVKSGSTWTATALQSGALPTQFIWDVAARPDDVNTVIVVMSGFGISHVWRGVVASSGLSATWTNVSGTGAGVLPDIPVNALVIDPVAPNTYYIATDVAVYRTTNGGTSWTQFSQGLPNCAVFDLQLRLLRAATHGRGLWERRLDVPSMPDVDLYFRDHLMATGRQTPTPNGVTAAFEDPLQYVALGDALWWWQCADVKVDALEGSPAAYQMPVATVDYAAYESKLQHRNAQRGKVNRVYVQVHNRGIAPAVNVSVKLLYANASAGLPALPPDFWTAFPNNSTNTTNWKPIGTAKLIPSLSPTEPAVLEWDWTTPTTAADHTCLLVVMDSPSNPIPAANKVFDVGALVPNEKRVGLKNLHVVDALMGTSVGVPLEMFAAVDAAHTFRVLPTTLGGWTVGLLWAKGAPPAGPAAAVSAGWITKKPSESLLKKLRDQLGDGVERFDTSRLFTLEVDQNGGVLEGVKIPKAGLRVLLTLTRPQTGKASATFTVVLERAGQVVGGNTFVLRGSS
jgi:photosystem II stability/assembly factor-like uncharacterized protein